MENYAKTLRTTLAEMQKLLREAEKEKEMYEFISTETQKTVEILEELYEKTDKYGEELDRAYDRHELATDNFNRAENVCERLMKANAYVMMAIEKLEA